KFRLPTIFNQMDPLFGVELSKGHGFFYTRSPLGDWQYGHPGVGGQFVKTDTKRRITFTYLTNGMKTGQDNDSIISYIAPITEQTAFSTFLAFFPFKRIDA
ncbi:hypothetical protein PRIPAC_90448, partial [Pristionchus pacificus]